MPLPLHNVALDPKRLELFCRPRTAGNRSRLSDTGAQLARTVAAKLSMMSPPEHPGGVPIRFRIASGVSAITQSPRRGPRLRLGSDDRAVPRDDRRARQAPPATASNAR